LLVVDIVTLNHSLNFLGSLMNSATFSSWERWPHCLITLNYALDISRLKDKVNKTLTLDFL